jgi:hypothetical protein
MGSNQGPMAALAGFRLRNFRSNPRQQELEPCDSTNIVGAPREERRGRATSYRQEVHLYAAITDGSLDDSGSRFILESCVRLRSFRRPPSPRRTCRAVEFRSPCLPSNPERPKHRVSANSEGQSEPIKNKKKRLTRIEPTTFPETGITAGCSVGPLCSLGTGNYKQTFTTA